LVNENFREKVKGIRLSDKRLEWWENHPEAAELVRGFIDRQIRRDEHIEQIKKAPPDLLEGLSKLVEELDDLEKGEAADQEEVNKAESKINELINTS